MREKSTLSRWLTWFSWGVIIFDLFIIFFMAEINFGNAQLLLFICAAWLILSLIVAATCLIVQYRKFFQTWTGWATPILLFIIGNMVVYRIIPVNIPSLILLFALIALVSFWCICPATMVFLWYRDVGLKLVAWGSVIIVWIMMFAWRFQGNLIELIFSGFSNMNSNSPSPLWWLNVLMCITLWIIPLGFISFLGHTIRLIMQESRN